MPRKRTTVASLARDAGMDLDEAIVTLWDAGIDQVEAGSDPVPAQLVRAARRALGLENAADKFKVDYWVEKSGLTREELARRLDDEAGVRLSPTARRIPKNSYRRFRRLFEAETVVEEDTKPAPIRLPPVEWVQIGSRRPSRFLTVGEVRGIHEALEEEFAASNDPIVLPGFETRASWSRLLLAR